MDFWWKIGANLIKKLRASNHLPLTLGGSNFGQNILEMSDESVADTSLRNKHLRLLGIGLELLTETVDIFL